MEMAKIDGLIDLSGGNESGLRPLELLSRLRHGCAMRPAVRVVYV